MPHSVVLLARYGRHVFPISLRESKRERESLSVFVRYVHCSSETPTDNGDDDGENDAVDACVCNENLAAHHPCSSN